MLGTHSRLQQCAPTHQKADARAHCCNLQTLAPTQLKAPQMPKQLQLSISILFLSLYFSLGSAFAQPCGPLSLDSINDPGPYSYGSLTGSDGIRNGPGYSGATIYYPINAPGPYSGIAIVPGYVSAQSSIQSWGPFLASHGIVAMTIGTNSIFENPGPRRDALLDALVTLKAEHTRAGSPLLDQLDTNSLAVGGWSMGGGGAQLAATADPSIKAVMALCPWLDNSSFTPSDIDHDAAILFLSAENDAVAPPAVHADVHYAQTPSSTNKMLFEIAGGNHQVANGPTGGSGYAGKIAVSWLKHFLVGDPCYCPLLLDTPPTASSYLTNVECSSTVSVAEVAGPGAIAYQLHPNPAKESIKLEVQAFEAGSSYRILSITGAEMSSGMVSSPSTRISITHLAPGTYIFDLLSGQNSRPTRFIVL